ncbi:2-amino-4-hydroxy-6-hydroxymethyldihydropteridine diphosphokinase [Salimicrobium flavidum]|uniref:2-amino-4-hydroxy-6-hydroxymethyldihydropteridine diphosphokinase n=1 Tax=Salimicrobium flavidum TaxID=570947 RepID=A0A1N7KK81_9BACI|nr:2-amino-4-hydroxy-6-hydroxymethyldihydropteridine diphosphokinase [Salimicrobium flavidum]SIS61967.1 2-amino-4-hydroxy-6-hydroxymethyldihydropteridinediphosphokinase [Salimicrobium flavidum]
MNTAYIALGSNISPREKFLQESIQQLEENPYIDVLRKSSIYETDPIGYVEQDDFLNMVIMMRTSLQPLELLDVCQEVEKNFGRERLMKWGPRTIDLDILALNQVDMKTERLILPHPHLHERAFALIPLADVNNDLILYPDGKTIKELVEELSDEESAAVRKVR